MCFYYLYSSGASAKVDMDSAVVMCRCLLEAQVRNYIKDHVRYVSNVKGSRCSHILTPKTTVSDALDHMQTCCGQLEGWKLFKNNTKLFTSAPGRSVYPALSESVHTADVKENQVQVPEFLEPIPKRFLLRLFTALQYVVKIVDRQGNVRDPVRDELYTAVPSPVKVTRKRSNSMMSGSESSGGSGKKAKKKKGQR